MISPQSISSFQDKILAWYKLNQRDLPWRKTRDPYKILVSEVMLQQTQVERVKPKYLLWIEQFPTVAVLAAAQVRDVLKAWSGLGYNSRALNLQKSAQVVGDKYNGIFPRSIKELQLLPGVGPYTASAVACFAYNAQIPVIDTNIRKVITHEFFKGVLPSEKKIEEVAREILPEGKAYTWNQALMDYSRLVLKDKKIPVAKQSHFQSSDRYYRGQVIKLLLEVEKISFSGLLDFFQDKNPVEPERLDVILKKMAKSGLLHYENSFIILGQM